MKKLGLLCLTVALIGGLGACSNNEQTLEPKPKLLDKEGIAPYDLNGEELYMLQSLALDKSAQLISFKAPKEAISMTVNVYFLNDNNEWILTEEIAENQKNPTISIGEDREPVDEVVGTLAIKDEGSLLEIIFNMGGVIYCPLEIKEFEDNYNTYGYANLNELHEIELEREIPISLKVYSEGTAIPAYTLEDFYTPQKFSELDHVQAITVTFSE